MSRSLALRYLVGTGLSMSVAFACSDDPAVLATGFDAPAFLDISGVSLGQGDVLVDGSSQLACDHTIAVSLTVDDWKLRPPGTCDVTQCGRVRLELSDSTHDKPLISQENASQGITLDLGQYFRSGEDAQLAAGSYTLTADLIDDAGNPYNPGDGGKGTAEVSFQLDLPTNCGASDGGAGAGGSGSSSDGGAAGLAGSAGTSVSAGAAGQSTGGSAGSNGTAGAGGTSGSGGTPAAGAAGE